MAGSRGAFGGSNVMALVRNDQSSADALVAMLASCPPVGQLHGQRGGGGGVGMELDAVVSCGQKRAYYPTFEGSQGEDLGEDEDLGDDCTGVHNVEKKRRLSFDQVRSLERNFEVENKLEPERKMQLAKELGLQPRQVAVWFQNRRARWKTKQLERDYEVLTLDYNRLKTDYDAVMQEKQELQSEIESLTGKVQASPRSGPVGVPAAPEKAAPTKARAKAAAPVVTSQAALAPSSKASDQVTVTVKSERIGKAEDTCSDSISSEIMDADSPRTMDSAPVLDKAGGGVTHPRVSSVCVAAEVNPVDSNIIHVSDHLCDQMLSPQACRRIAVKLEDGSFQDESASCNYILTQLDEERGLPWWDWP